MTCSKPKENQPQPATRPGTGSTGYLIRRTASPRRFARYIQNHTLEDELNDRLPRSRGGPPPYAGADRSLLVRYSLVKILGDPKSEGAKGFAAFLEEEKRFVDFTRSTVFVRRRSVSSTKEQVDRVRRPLRRLQVDVDPTRCGRRGFLRFRSSWTCNTADAAASTVGPSRCSLLGPQGFPSGS